MSSIKFFVLGFTIHESAQVCNVRRAMRQSHEFGVCMRRANALRCTLIVWQFFSQTRSKWRHNFNSNANSMWGKLSPLWVLLLTRLLNVANLLAVVPFCGDTEIAYACTMDEHQGVRCVIVDSRCSWSNDWVVDSKSWKRFKKKSG